MTMHRLLRTSIPGTLLLALLGACREETTEYGDDVRAAERDASATQTPADGRAPGAEPRGAVDAPRPREAAYGGVEDAPELARVDLQPIGESGVTGYVLFERDGDELRVTGRIEGLSPGLHGFHVHEFGDLSDTRTGESAGSHFAPEGSPHGMPEAETRHVGDLGNVEANEEGVAVIDMRDRHIRLHGESSILGRALVVHESPDDGGQPTGNAGGRLAFGVVVIANPASPR